MEIYSKYLIYKTEHNQNQRRKEERNNRITEEYLTQEEPVYPVVLTKSNLNGVCMVAVYLKCSDILIVIYPRCLCDRERNSKHFKI